MVLVTFAPLPRDPSYVPTLPAIEYPVLCPPPLPSCCPSVVQILVESPLSSIQPPPTAAPSGSDLPDKARVASPIAMSSSTPVNQDPALAPPPPATAPPAGPPAADAGASPHVLDSTQIVQLLRHFPSVYQVSRATFSSFPFVPFPLRAGCTTPRLSVSVGSSGVGYV